MNKKTLNIILIALLVVNVATLSVLWMKPGRGHKKPNGDRLIHKLGFDQAQQDAFYVLRDEHEQSVGDLQHSNHEIREQYKALMESNNAESVDSLAKLVGANVAEMELLHFRFFQEVRALCTGDQVEKLDHIMRKMHEGRPGPPTPPGRPPHGPGR